MLGNTKGPIDYVRLNKYLADTNYLGVSKKAVVPTLEDYMLSIFARPRAKRLWLPPASLCGAANRSNYSRRRGSGAANPIHGRANRRGV